MLAAGCSGDEQASPDSRLDAAFACGASQPEPCDVFDAACRQQIAAVAACQWGGPNTPVVLPDVMTLTQDEYRALLTSDASMAQDTNPEVGEAANAADHVLSLLGLIDMGDLSVDAGVDRQVEGVLAYYAFGAKNITIIGRSDAADPIIADSTLFHELIHAQQDAAHDLTAFVSKFPGTADAGATVKSLFEGEAQFHEWIYQIGLLHTNVDAAGFAYGLSEIRTGWESQVLSGPSALLNSLQTLPYNYGPLWIDTLWKQGGSGAVQKRYERTPTDLLEVLESTWAVPAEKASIIPFPVANVFAPDGAAVDQGSQYFPLTVDRLGAWTVYVAAHLFGDDADAQQLALGWRGDQLDVYRLDAGGYGGRWRVSFDSAEHAAAFTNLFSGNANAHLRAQGPTVVAVVSDSSEPEDWLYGPYSN